MNQKNETPQLFSPISANGAQTQAQSHVAHTAEVRTQHLHFLEAEERRLLVMGITLLLIGFGAGVVVGLEFF